MINLPPEILLGIGELLEKQSLLACLQVSQDWYYALHLTVWTTISKQHWIHPAFPLRQWTPLPDDATPYTDAQKKRDTKILRCLQQTYSLTFHDNKSLRSTGIHIRLPTQIAMSQLHAVVQRTSNLVRFSLVMWGRGPSDYILSLILKLLYEMPRLEAVEINLERRRLFPIKRHFPLFAKLKEIRIEGDWYRGVKTVGPAPDKIMPWKLQHLTIDCLDMSFFRYCPNLEKLSFNPKFSTLALPKIS
ncbi:hypothetical protein BG015_011411 [Linnemannia schmuckeri]|uniref:F-box domain-containing protein n=1 Tax=Linnemannia schmuckeri TaxID=64567 RepID=A0A9P5RT36_9FUNG|nr:hypothetical protein BG015_011411 [Linnemannia schmuckeri]